jgi:hypothetical protein
MSCICMCVFMLFQTNVLDILELQSYVTTKYNYIGSIATACNLSIDGFLLISSFLGFHKCFLIMEAQERVLSIGDIFRLYGRKFLRLAPSYYGIWMMEWSLTSRLAGGKLWYRTNDLYISCNE